MQRTLDVATSLFASVARLGSGLMVGGVGQRPEKPLELYEFEGCPFCRKAREALSAHDLEALVYPCPRGSRYRARVRELGGKELFPFLVDPNTGRSMYESDDITRYLADTYGDGKRPLLLSLGPVNTVSSAVASLWRPGRGGKARAAREPARPLELWSFEASPYCRIAREALSELQIPYLLHNVAKGSPSRAAFEERSGKMMVPYLVDPNTGIGMFESADIVAYLHTTYGMD